ncbi:NAD(P)/FAD-dependent oxidoreductase [Marinobacterium lutimaris]|uniref:NADPH-dependent 2,4-dienoyl-CoA reductase, sulfur reductase n=1 Tax=Marinobacterium lutimaris TaxID=568106 RepID=A0A1H5TQ45_9GAMM|nr:NAD(P)/FAD-dependent oxidoreductase [Marinobacterium lutimaris]SEF64899.1 NADPH-dependent 2,4-dienoyl-CoA reductase, sulfur reductase [Marinobacterium lutimaris]
MKYDLVIIGAGPAGMSAAIEASGLGLSCLLLDEQPRGGGQIYRNAGHQRLSDKQILGPEYQAGVPLLEAFKASQCEHITGATAWQIEPKGEVFYSVAGKSQAVSADRVLIASGAQERPMPIPGWTLPGVMTAGGAQTLLKNSGLAAEDAVFAGCGPLLYLIVWQYVKAGVNVKAVLDTTESGNYVAAAKEIGAAWSGRSYLKKGLKLISDIKAAGVTIHKHVDQIAAIADDQQKLTAVSFSGKSGRHKLDTDHLFLHQGVIPQVNLAMASGCKHHWNDQQLCWTPETDAWGQSNEERLFIAGDGLGIGGAVAAALRGRLAALQIASLSGNLDASARDSRAQPIRKALDKELAFRPFLDVLYRPAEQFRSPPESETVICRCEEVRLSELKAATEKGCLGPNQLKSFTRCGMGPCQGRQCGITVSETLSRLTKRPVEETGYYRLRAPVKPLNLSELASLKDEN